MASRKKTCQQTREIYEIYEIWFKAMTPRDPHLDRFD